MRNTLIRHQRISEEYASVSALLEEVVRGVRKSAMASWNSGFGDYIFNNNKVFLGSD